MGFAIIDLETTGTEAETDEIIDIAVVLVDDQGSRQIQIASTMIHPYIDDLMPQFDQAPTFAEFGPLLTHLLEGRTLVFHNAAFDLRLLSAEMLRYGLRPPLVRGVRDTLKMSRAAGSRGHKLESACKKAGLSPAGLPLSYPNWSEYQPPASHPWHTASFDAWMTWRLFSALSPDIATEEGSDWPGELFLRGVNGLKLLERIRAGIPPRSLGGAWTLRRDYYVDEPWGKYDGHFERRYHPSPLAEGEVDFYEIVFRPDGTIDHEKTDTNRMAMMWPAIEEAHDRGARTPRHEHYLAWFASYLSGAHLFGHSTKSDAIAFLEKRFPDWAWWIRVKSQISEEAHTSDQFVAQLIEHHDAGRSLGAAEMLVIAEWGYLQPDNVSEAQRVFRDVVGEPARTQLGGALAKLERMARRVPGEDIDAFVASMVP